MRENPNIDPPTRGKHVAWNRIAGIREVMYLPKNKESQLNWPELGVMVGLKWNEWTSVRTFGSTQFIAVRRAQHVIHKSCLFLDG